MRIESPPSGAMTLSARAAASAGTVATLRDLACHSVLHFQVDQQVSICRLVRVRERFATFRLFHRHVLRGPLPRILPHKFPRVLAREELQPHPSTRSAIAATAGSPKRCDQRISARNQADRGESAANACQNHLLGCSRGNAKRAREPWSVVFTPAVT